MEEFPDYLYRRLAEGLLLFENPRLNEIYILSLYIDFDSGPHRVKLWLYYNTNHHLSRSIEQGEDPEEARWNFALWEQDYMTALGLTAEEYAPLADEAFHRLLADWLRGLGLYRSPEEIERMIQQEDAEEYTDWDQRVREQLLDLFVAVARQLQETGLVLAKFGRCIPLLIHEWDYNPWTLEATRWINPLGLAHGFEEWLLRETMGGEV